MMTNEYQRPGAAGKLFHQVAEIPGFFNYDDAQHFSLILNMQRSLSITGDILEIGTWKGRSAAFLSYFLSSTETLYLNDVFSTPATDTYAEYPKASDVRAAIKRLNAAADSRIVFLEGLSNTVVFPVAARCRFVHIDGGHSVDECYADLRKILPHVIPTGIVAVDDYDHPDWPGVKPATDRWLSENPEFQIIADMNRITAKGRKLYAIRRA